MSPFLDKANGVIIVLVWLNMIQSESGQQFAGLFLLEFLETI